MQTEFLRNKKLLKKILPIMLAVASVLALPWQGGAQVETPLSQSVFLNVPYTSQAPLGEWADPRQRDGCEEASILMAMMWIWGVDLPKEELAREIDRIADYEKYFYGYYEDTGVEDTAKLMRDYFHYENIEVRQQISVADIKASLNDGHPVIIPVDTRLLGISAYRYGPLRHMVVATGYDLQTGTIILNDPYISTGHNLRVNESYLNRALWNYYSGVHLPLPLRSTAMIVVKK